MEPKKLRKNFGFSSVNLQIAPYFSIFLGGIYAHLGGGAFMHIFVYIYCCGGGIESLKVSKFQAQLEGKVSYVIPLTLFLYNFYLISKISYVKPKLSRKMTGSSAVVK